jgi:glycosyltransferase involved in cell wall biosynthesis
MKIGLYIPAWPPGSTANGIVTYASQLVPALRRLGHDVLILTLNKTVNGSDPYTIDLRTFLSTPSLRRRVMFRLAPDDAAFYSASSAITSAVRELAANHELDVFEVEESFGWSSALSRLRLLPVVVRLHGPWFLNGRFDDPDENPAKKRRRETREGVGVALANFVTAPSAEVLEAVKQHYALGLTASRVIANPIDPADRAKKWDLENCDKDSILFVGRFDRRKGGELVIRAFAELAPSYPRLKLTFVGPDRGVKGDDGKIWSFERFAQSCVTRECLPRITFCGKVAHSEIEFLRVKHFATIVASQYEIMPYSVLEAMALGCPVVATAVGGIPELIKDERNGLLVAPGDVGALVGACRRLLEDKGLAARLGLQAWRDCRDHYNPGSIAMQTEAAYEAAIDQFKAQCA